MTMQIETKLLEEVKKIGNYPNRGAAINAALKEYIAKHKRLECLKSFGTFDFEPDFDYKQQRKQR